MLYPPSEFSGMTNRILVVGGTQGIGKATAIQFAKLGSSVDIIGRNQTLGNEVINQLKTLNSQSEFAFHNLDVTNISAVKQFCNDYKLKNKGFNGLILCAGGLNYGERRETKEGVEIGFAQNYLSRFVLIHQLVPLLELSHGRVVHCLGAGQGADYVADDLQLKNGFSVLKVAKQHACLGDLMVKEFAKRYHNSRFFHFFPGLVNTNSVANQNFPWILQIGFKIVGPLIAKSPETVAQTITKLVTEKEYWAEEFNGIGINEKGGVVPSAHYMTQENGEALWAYSVNLMNSL